MKILYFSHSYGSPTTTFIRNETDHFSKEHDVKYLCSELFVGDLKPPYVETISFYENRFLKKIRWLLWKWDFVCNFYNKDYSAKINTLINSFQPDVIHCHFAYEALMLLDNLDNINKHKLIVHFHGYDATQMINKKSYVKRLNDYLSRRNIFTISCNQYFIKTLTQKLNVNLSTYLVLKYGINLDTLFKPDSIEKKTDVIVFTQVSSLVEKKGHEYTLRAYKRFLDSNPHIHSVLKLTGSGERLSKLQQLAKDLGIEKNVKFLGSLKPKQIASLLNESSVFLHHSITDANGDMEGIPNAIMEAMAMELPIISTFHSGIPELVEDGVNGYLVNEKDVESYAIRMKDAIRMGKLPKNRMKILNEYNIDLHNKLLYDYYRKCIGIQL